MSKYTTEVRFLCESLAGLKHSTGYDDVNQTIMKAIPKIFSFDFPIFDEGYRNILCSKILKHYYTREISEETVGLWKLRLDARLNEIMPYYNQLYKSELLEFNPLWDTDLTTEHDIGRIENRDTNEDETNGKNSTSNRTKDQHNSYINEQTAHSTNDSDSTNLDLYSDTPQGGLSYVESGEYLTNARKTSGNNISNSDGTSNDKYTGDTLETNEDTFKENIIRNKTTTDDLTSTENYLQRITGKSSGVSYAKLIAELRENFLNIDVDVINALSDLFMCLW